MATSFGSSLRHSSMKNSNVSTRRPNNRTRGQGQIQVQVPGQSSPPNGFNGLNLNGNGGPLGNNVIENGNMNGNGQVHPVSNSSPVMGLITTTTSIQPESLHKTTANTNLSPIRTVTTTILSTET